MTSESDLVNEPLSMYTIGIAKSTAGYDLLIILHFKYMQAFLLNNLRKLGTAGSIQKKDYCSNPTTRTEPEKSQWTININHSHSQWEQ